MKTSLALLALALLTTVAQAKTWVNDDCSLAVTSDAEGFHYETTITNRTQEFDTLCTVGSWPISSAAAAMTCDNGSAPKLSIISDDEINFDGKTFSTKTDACIEE